MGHGAVSVNHSQNLPLRKQTITQPKEQEFTIVSPVAQTQETDQPLTFK